MSSRWGVRNGEGGIRTPDRGISPYNGLANRRLQPLGHLSNVAALEVSATQEPGVPPVVPSLCCASSALVRGDSENVAKRTTKSRQHVLTVQLAVRFDSRDRSVSAVDARVSADLVEDPHDPHARAQPLAHLLQHLAGPVVG